MKTLSIGEMRIAAINALYMSVQRSYACNTVHVEPLAEPREMKGVCIKNVMYETPKDNRVGNNAQGLERPDKADRMELLLATLASLNKKASNAMLYIDKLKNNIASANNIEVKSTTGIEWVKALKIEAKRKALLAMLKRKLVQTEILFVAFTQDCERVEREVNDLAAQQMRTSGMRKLKLRKGKRKGATRNKAVAVWQAKNIAAKKAQEMRNLESFYTQKNCQVAS